MGCRRIAPRDELLRVVAVDGRATPDPEGRRPGRGAYVCRRPECWERAVARNALSRTFRRPVSVPSEPLHLSPR